MIVVLAIIVSVILIVAATIDSEFVKRRLRKPHVAQPDREPAE